MKNTRSWFQARGYPKYLAQKEMKKINFTIINVVKGQKTPKD